MSSHIKNNNNNNNICKICNINEGVKTKEIFTCNLCFTKSFIKKFRSSIRPFYDEKSLIIFDGSLPSAVLFYLLKTNINTFHKKNYIFISNTSMPYEDILTENYQFSEISFKTHEWLKKYNSTNLIKPETISLRVQEIINKVCHLDFNETNDYCAPFGEVLDAEIERFYDIHSKDIFYSGNLIESNTNKLDNLNKLDKLSEFDKANKSFCSDLTSWNPSSLFNISKVDKKLNKKN